MVNTEQGRLQALNTQAPALKHLLYTLLSKELSLNA